MEAKIFAEVNPALCVGIAVLMLLAAAVTVIYRKRYKINIFWALLAIICSGGAMLLCLVGTSVGTVYAKPAGDPQETVTDFFDGLVTGDYVLAYSLMKDYSDLGLSNEPETEAAKLVYTALKASYDYKLDGPCQVELLHAQQPVVMRYLDIAKATAGLDEATMEELKEIVQTRSHNAVYDENDQYLPQVTDEAYLSALKGRLKNAANYYTTVEFTLTLDYINGNWQITTAPELLVALSGGTGV